MMSPARPYPLEGPCRMPAKPRLPSDVESHVVDLVIAHQRHEPVRLPAGSRGPLQEWIERLLVNEQLLHAHRRFLQERLRDGFRFQECLPLDLVGILVEGGVGPAMLDDQQLAELLLNPVALYDLAEAIADDYPPWWAERIERESRRTVEEAGLAPPPFAPFVGGEMSLADDQSWPSLPLGSDESVERPKGESELELASELEPACWSFEVPVGDPRCRWLAGNRSRIHEPARILIVWSAGERGLEIRLSGFLTAGDSAQLGVSWLRGRDLLATRTACQSPVWLDSPRGGPPQAGDRLRIAWSDPRTGCRAVVELSIPEA